MQEEPAVLVKLSQLEDGTPTVIKQKRRSSLKEATLLETAKGEGIVRLFNYWDAGPCGLVLVEERLCDMDSLGLEMFSPSELKLLLIRLFCDGLAALQTLRRVSIVHRDISPNNLMYSTHAQAWRLTDFGAACQLPDGVTEQQSDHLYGTPGYIAPDARDHKRYSTATDAWSFATTANYFLRCIEQENERRGDRDEWDDSLQCTIVMLQVYADLLGEDPCKLDEMHSRCQENHAQMQVNIGQQTKNNTILRRPIVEHI